MRCTSCGSENQRRFNGEIFVVSDADLRQIAKTDAE